MTTKIPDSCPPDKYLTERHLQELFDDFNTSITTSRSPASIFSSLVTSIRHVYTRVLLQAREERIEELKSRVQDQRGLKVEAKVEPERINECCSCNLDKAPISQPEESPATTDVVGDSVGALEKTSSEIQSWPVNTFRLYIFSNNKPYRRDWASWGSIFKDESGEEWDARMDFKVFKYKEPGMIKIRVLKMSSREQIWVTRGEGELYGHKEHLEFWAFDNPRPGTQMIWGGSLFGYDSTIFVKGDQGSEMVDWVRRLEFWVPV